MYMTLYYNPRSRKPHIWIVAMPVAIPVLLVALILYFGSKRLELKIQEEKRRAKVDVFDKF